MSVVMSEKVKHRLVGVIVLISIAVIFLPAVMKKSNRNFEKNIKIALKLPAKPDLPKVNTPTDKDLFKQVNIARTPDIKVPKVKKSLLIAKASSLDKKTKVQLANANVKSSIPDIKPLVAKAISDAKTSDVKSVERIYSIQVATFTKQNNADLLVQKLKKNGFVASYNKIDTKGVVLYQVVVGRVKDRDKAMNLQEKLASSMQLNGFIINRIV